LVPIRTVRFENGRVKQFSTVIIRRRIIYYILYYIRLLVTVVEPESYRGTGDAIYITRRARARKSANRLR